MKISIFKRKGAPASSLGVHLWIDVMWTFVLYWDTRCVPIEMCSDGFTSEDILLKRFVSCALLHISFVCVQRLRCEAGSHLVPLDSLTQKNRTLTRLFQGTMQARLLASARECGRRWDDVNAKLESITGRLQVPIITLQLLFYSSLLLHDALFSPLNLKYKTSF